MRIIAAFVLVFFAHFLLAQSVHISGIVMDLESGEPLTGAILTVEDTEQFDVTNAEGYFNLLLPDHDSIYLQVQYIGYETKRLAVAGKKDQIINVYLHAGIALTTIEISADHIIEHSKLGSTTLTPLEIERLPTLLGEADVLKSLQILPGISGGKEGTSLLYVRGGTPDQNMTLLDGIPVYFPAHLGGFLSVFEPRSIQQIKVYKGGFPAQYGGRVSSVLDIRMKDGDFNNIKSEIGLGLLSSRFFVEGPLKKEQTSFHLSIRRSFLDLLYGITQLIVNNEDEKVNYGILDANLKVKHKLNKNNRLFFSYYGGKDNIRLRFKGSNQQYSLKETTRIKWGNQLAGLRWSHLRKKSVWNNALSFTTFAYKTRAEFESTENATNEKKNEINEFQSRILDFIFHSSAHFTLSNQTDILAGVKAVRHNFQPKVERFKGNVENNSVDTTFSASNTINHELSGYVESNFRIGKNWSVNSGIHANWYFADQSGYQHFSLQPRFLLSYQPSKAWQFSSSLSQMIQPLHLLSNSGGGLPVDIWVPASAIAPVEKSWLYAAGVSFLYQDWEVQLESYYKTLNNLIAFQEGTSFFRGTTDWESKIAAGGKGQSYGIECLVKKHWKKWDISIAYTFAKHLHKFPELNNGLPFPYRYDRRHDLALNLSFKPNSNQQLSLLWVYHTGEAISLSKAGFDVFTLGFGSISGNNYFLENGLHEAHYYGSRNSFRMPAYHRLDLSWQLEKSLKRGTRKWIIGLYNSYNRINPYYIYFDENDQGDRQLYQFGLFPLLPSVSWIRSW